MYHRKNHSTYRIHWFRASMRVLEYFFRWIGTAVLHYIPSSLSQSAVISVFPLWRKSIFHHFLLFLVAHVLSFLLFISTLSILGTFLLVILFLVLCTLDFKSQSLYLSIFFFFSKKVLVRFTLFYHSRGFRDDWYMYTMSQEKNKL